MRVDRAAMTVAIVIVKLLKSQLDAKFTMTNDDRAGFSEFYRAKLLWPLFV